MTIVVTHTTPADSSFSTEGAAAWNADHALSGVGTMAEQNANNVAITGGAIDNTVIGNTTPNAATFTSLSSNGATTLVNGSGSFSIDDGGGSPNTFRFIGPTSTLGRNRLYSPNQLRISTGSTNPIQFHTAASSSVNGDGNVQFAVTNTASAVNYVQVTGAATGSWPVVSAQGSDSAVSLGLTAKGGNAIIFFTNSGSNRGLRVSHVANAVNYLDVAGSATNQEPVMSVVGNDTNISMAFQSKGTGGIDLAAGSNGVNISNGGTVTAITGTSAGSGYTSFPTPTVSAPTTAGGVQAVIAVARMFNSGAAVQAGGTGYTVNDVLTVTGGTPLSAAATLTVTSVSAGVITGISTTNQSTYTALPTNPVSVTGGTGSGAALNLTWAVVNGSTGYTITNAGSGYVEQPTVTFSGGGGSGAAAFAYVGSMPVIKTVNSAMALQTPNANMSLQIMDDATIGAGASALYIVGASSSLGRVAVRSNKALYFGSGSTNSISFNTNTSTTSDGSGQFAITHTASAVNYVQVTGAATGNLVRISAQGSDANVGMELVAKGAPTGPGFRIANTNGVCAAVQMSVSNPANYPYLQPAASGSAPSFSANGSDTNIGLNLTTKGTGAVNVSNGGGQMFLVSSTGASSVNYVAVYGNTQSPEIRAEGSTAALDLQFLSKSTGSHMFYTSGTSYLKQFQVSHTASAVNYVQVTGAATGGNVTISTQGSDASVFGTLLAKGSGGWDITGNGPSTFRNSAGANQFRVTPTSSAVNLIQATGAVAGAAPSFSSIGSDTNIDLALTPKGTGLVRFGTYTASMALTVQGYIEIKDSGGTVRKLAVIA